jgi:hypothetical protein
MMASPTLSTTLTLGMLGQLTPSWAGWGTMMLCCQCDLTDTDTDAVAMALSRQWQNGLVDASLPLMC